ncbi:hypothetical protein I6A84_42995 [Frankia sp. CNm7]|uniref:Double-GTPase 2 domain-containing protein n=1 Tax=Frankia nepalensis TaxID=1836974 RepID=A0A937RRN8_9ACTN|nr:hypothetical protein [Frankia nepalensis]MBL7499540.1 hypothetical protein [Frankia nepalensis]MBL7515619.1 hypothetical protein [Frankia nepalensis]MBL7524632.1 hypothetical protein [Frankia nepalensis]MBL7630716.1 hypothetical protein [Frankia nepalensis]
MDEAIVFILGAILFLMVAAAILAALVGFFVFVGPVLGAGTALFIFFALVVAFYQELGRAFGLGGSPKTLAVEAPPRQRTPEGREPAYTQYLFEQARRDFSHAHKLAWARLTARYNGYGRTFQSHWFQGFADWRWPVGVVLVVGQAVGGLLALVLLALTAASQVLVLLVVGLVALGGIYLLRGADTLLMWARGVRITCPACYERGFYPSYECDGCATRHQDVRPGRYGVIRRVCACGTRLPTLLLLGSHRLRACCAHCGAPLAERAGTAAEIVLPVFGAVAAGKTRLMIVVMMAIEALARRGGARVELADDDTRAWEANARRELIDSGAVQKTRVRLPRAYSLYVKPARGSRRLVHVFDAAGEYFNRSENLQELRYLRAASTFVFVIDPLSLGALWSRLPAEVRDRYQQIRAAQEPEFVFAQAVDNLTAMGVKTGRARLVVVVTKSDLVRPVLAADGVEDREEALVGWLDDKLGQGNLLRAMRHAFGETHFFLTASVLDQAYRVDDSVERLTSWTLARHGLRLT